MKLFLLLISSPVLLSSGCSKNRNLDLQTVPSSLFFLIKKNGNRLPDSTLDQMRLYYMENSIRKYVSDFQRATGDGYALGVQTSRNIGDLSADLGIKDYYLEFGPGDTDTLYVNYVHLSERDARNHSCLCYYPLELVRYNGQTSSPDPAITQQKVYSFEKR